MSNDTQIPSWPITLSTSGRMIIPKEARDFTGWGQGEELIVCPGEDGGLEIKTLDAFIKQVQHYFADKFGDRNLVDELIAERREEAASEESHS